MLNSTVLRGSSFWQSAASVAGGITLVTWLGFAYPDILNISILGFLYLLCVLWAAYRLHFVAAMLSALAAFLLMNYCFIEPRYTLRVGNLHAWLMLLVFALVAFTVSSVMQQLKQQTLQASRAAQQSRFFQSLAELLATQTTASGLLQDACEHAWQGLGVGARVMQYRDTGDLSLLAATTGALSVLQPSSVRWALDYQRAIGAGTVDWPTLAHCIVPFGPQHREVLVIEADEGMPDVQVLRMLALQIAQAYANLTQRIALAQAAREVSEATFRQTLLTALSHDMRTPLTAILGAVHVLADRQITLTATQSGQLLQSIQAESQFLAQATENILTLVRLEAGAGGLHLDWQSPLDIVQHVLQRYQQRQPPVPLQVTIPSEPVLVRMDAVLVAHALVNLVDNALHWRFADTPIELSLTIDERWLALTVSNQGPGFPADFVIAAFASRTQSRAGARGFGLGLSIADSIMQLHGGRLEIAAQAGATTQVRMWFQLPDQAAYVMDAT